jgi:hypothetical protein
MKRLLVINAALMALAMPAAAQAQEEPAPDPCQLPLIYCVNQVIDRGQALVNDAYERVDRTWHSVYYTVEYALHDPCGALYGDRCPISTRG